MNDHVVAQVIETEFVVRAEGDVAAVGEFTFGKIHVVQNQADAQAQKMIKPTHPLRVAAGKVIVDGDHVHAFSAERVQIHGQRRNQRFAFAGLHFGDFAFVQTHAAHELNIEMSHTQNSTRRFTADGKRFGQDVFHCFARGKSFAKSVRRGGELVVGEILVLRFKCVDFIDRLLQTFDLLVVVVAQKKFLQESEQNYHSPKIFRGNYSKVAA